VSPRSEEFLAEATERLEAARMLLERQLLGAAVSDAYYAMLYAARAALSERDRSAKTHSGTWNLFHEEFVADGSFEAALAREARATQEPRESVDYAAARVPVDEAERIVEVAARFLAGISGLIGPAGPSAE
jgi:uncharacterized protein (UPF0332 family)